MEAAGRPLAWGLCSTSVGLAASYVLGSKFKLLDHTENIMEIGISLPWARKTSSILPL